jgi:hypothetical protein
LSGWRGKLLKRWTVLGQIAAGSGLPQTPIYLAAVTGTGFTGSIRPNVTGASVYDAPAGFHLNAAAYARHSRANGETRGEIRSPAPTRSPLMRRWREPSV